MTPALIDFAPGLAANMARARHVPMQHCEDMAQSALLALCSASGRIDKARSPAEQRAYAVATMRGGALDYLRGIDPLTRRDRAQVRAGALGDISHVPLSPAIAMEPQAETGIAARELMRFLRSVPLPPKYAPVAHGLLQGESAEETSARLRLPVPRIFTYRYRVITAYRRAMKAHGLTLADFAR
jgi:DNA-directed RNA polymerase specialized sigma24 family protein